MRQFFQLHGHSRRAEPRGSQASALEHKVHTDRPCTACALRCWQAFGTSPGVVFWSLWNVNKAEYTCAVKLACAAKLVYWGTKYTLTALARAPVWYFGPCGT